MEANGEAFNHARDLILWMKNEFPKNAMRAIHSDNGTELNNNDACMHLMLRCMQISLNTRPKPRAYVNTMV